MIQPTTDARDQYIPHPSNLKLLLRSTAASTSAFYDFSGYGRAVTNGNAVTGATTQVLVEPFSIFCADATNNYLSVPYSADFTFDKEFTIVLDVYCTDYPDDYNSFISTSNTAGAQNGWNLQFNTSGDPTVYFVHYINDAQTKVTTTNTLTLDAWNTIIITRTASTVSVNLNGTVTSGTIAGTLTANSGVAMRFGVANDARKLNGYISHVAIWSGVVIPTSKLRRSKIWSFRRA